jgi:septal ring factor EnvC (AmiA/AmiB activator)
MGAPRAASPSRATVIATGLLTLAVAAVRPAAMVLAPDAAPLHAATLAALALAITGFLAALGTNRLEQIRVDQTGRTLRVAAESSAQVGGQVASLRTELSAMTAELKKLRECIEAAEANAYFAGYIDRSQGKPPAEQYLTAFRGSDLPI